MLLHTIPLFPPLFLQFPKFPLESPCCIDVTIILFTVVCTPLLANLGVSFARRFFVLRIFFCDATTVRIMAFSLPVFNKGQDLFNGLAGMIPYVLLVLTRRKQLQIPRHLKKNRPNNSMQRRLNGTEGGGRLEALKRGDQGAVSLVLLIETRNETQRRFKIMTEFQARNTKHDFVQQ